MGRRKNTERRCQATGKIQYRDRLAARLALASINRKKDTRQHLEHHEYRCPYCLSWHLTSLRN